MKERTIDILTAVFLIAFSLVMRSQLEGIPREGVLFPLCVLYLIMASSVLLALRAIMAGKGEMSFFGDIPPQRWCLVTAVFIAQVLGAMYVSFNICMAVGIFAMLIVLTSKKTGKALLANLVFTAACFSRSFSPTSCIFTFRSLSSDNPPFRESFRFLRTGGTVPSHQRAACFPYRQGRPSCWGVLVYELCRVSFSPSKAADEAWRDHAVPSSWMFCSGDSKPDCTAAR